MTTDLVELRRSAHWPGRQGTVPASSCSLEALTDIYNATRADYLVPMPMSVDSMRRYIARYDVDLEASVVIVGSEAPAGLGMLGVREGRGWVTRLGVVPEWRRRSTARRIVTALLARARERGVQRLELEVIRENVAARQLFASVGFQPTRELSIMSREADLLAGAGSAAAVPVSVLPRPEIEALLASRAPGASWLTETESFLNMGNLLGFAAAVGSGDPGWCALQCDPDSIDHIILGAAAKTDMRIGLALLSRLHADHPGKSASVQNLPVDNPSLVVFRHAGYTEDFRRIEMHLDLAEEGSTRGASDSRDAT